MFSALGSGLLGISQYDYLNQQPMNQHAAQGLWPSAAQSAAMLQNTSTHHDSDERLLVLLTEE